MTISLNIEPAEQPELLAPGTAPRPPWIDETAWARMPWPAKWKAARTHAAAVARRAEIHLVPETDLDPEPPELERRHRGPIPVQPHGTYAAARRHERHGEPLCPPCRAARRAYRGADPRTPARTRDIDPVLVDRFIRGEAHWKQLTVAERVSVARRLDAAGISRNEIRRRTHLNTGTLRSAWPQEAS